MKVKKLCKESQFFSIIKKRFHDSTYICYTNKVETKEFLVYFLPMPAKLFCGQVSHWKIIDVMSNNNLYCTTYNKGKLALQIRLFVGNIFFCLQSLSVVTATGSSYGVARYEVVYSQNAVVYSPILTVVLIKILPCYYIIVRTVEYLYFRVTTTFIIFKTLT